MVLNTTTEIATTVEHTGNHWCCCWTAHPGLRGPGPGASSTSLNLPWQSCCLCLGYSFTQSFTWLFYTTFSSNSQLLLLHPHFLHVTHFLPRCALRSTQRELARTCPQPPAVAFVSAYFTFPPATQKRHSSHSNVNSFPLALVFIPLANSRALGGHSFLYFLHHQFVFFSLGYFH